MGGTPLAGPSPRLNRDYLEEAAATLRLQGVEIGAGLTEAQLRAVEDAHGFRFPPDLRSLLEAFLPVGPRFPDWREPGSPALLERFAWPADSICFDVEHDGFWFPAWGDRPSSLEEAKESARAGVRAAPFLLPIFAHRYLPALPCEAGNPVFSVYQTDIIHYGFDLASYLNREFKIPNPFPIPEGPREIEFWSDLERMNG